RRRDQPRRYAAENHLPDTPWEDAALQRARHSVGEVRDFVVEVGHAALDSARHAHAVGALEERLEVDVLDVGAPGCEQVPVERRQQLLAVRPPAFLWPQAGDLFYRYDIDYRAGSPRDPGVHKRRPPGVARQAGREAQDAWREGSDIRSCEQVN